MKSILKEAAVTMENIKYYETENICALGIPVIQKIKIEDCINVTEYAVKPKYNIEMYEDKVKIFTYSINLPGDQLGFKSIIKNSKFIKDVQLIIRNEKAEIVFYSHNNISFKVFDVKRRYSKVENNIYEFRTYINILSKKRDIETSKLIVIDPGHGGSQLGAVDNFLYEKHLNFDISNRLAKKLKKKGYEVCLTRDSDEDIGLLDRTDMANLLQADLFFSVHNNSVPLDMSIETVHGLRGITILYNSNAPRSGKKFGTILLEEIANKIGTNTTPFQDRPDLGVLNSCWCPAIILEASFLSDDSDAKIMMHRIYREKIAEASSMAVENYFNSIEGVY
jgi:N-acetylmuramoyl-L-alanine amidase